MEKPTTIYGKQIKNLITRFYYKNKELCYQIILHIGLNQTIIYKEFEDYHMYQKKFNELLEAKNHNDRIVIPKIHSQDSYPDLKVA